MAQLDIPAIQAALVAAGVNVGEGIATRGETLYAVQADGALVPIPEQAVIALGTLPTLPGTPPPSLAERVATALAGAADCPPETKAALLAALAGG